MHKAIVAIASMYIEITFVVVAPASLAADPAPLQLESLIETYINTPLVGASPFAALQQVWPEPRNAEATVTFIYASNTKREICFTLISRDGRYRATASVANSKLRDGETYSIDIDSKYRKVIAQMTDRDLGVEVRYFDNCDVHEQSTPRAVSWIGRTRPEGPIWLIFQSLNHDSIFIPDMASSSHFPCDRFVGSSNMAFDTHCAFDPNQLVQLTPGIVRIFDIEGGVAEEIRLTLK